MQAFQVQDTPCFYITEQAELVSMVEQLADQPLLAVDTEFLRTNTFYPIVGLIQIASSEVCYLIDPLSCESLEPLRKLLLNNSKRLVMHACSEDIEVLQRIFGALPDTVFDTQIAASMVSRDHQLGLQRLISTYCGIDIPKDETRSDWTKRPLTENQMVYAALDVVLLLKVYDALADKLSETGRMSWCEEECQRVIEGYRHATPADLYYRTIGDAWKLKGKKLQVLQALAEWREIQAHERDKPRGFIFSDRELFAIADQLPRSNVQLSQVAKLKPVQIRRYGEPAIDLIDRVMSEEQAPLDPVPKPFNNQTKKVVKAIKPEVEKLAIELDMATDRLSNRRNLEKLVTSLIEQRPLPNYYEGWRQLELVPRLRVAVEKYAAAHPQS